MVKEVSQPQQPDRDQYHPRRAESPGSRSSPSNAARADGELGAGHVGKSGSGHASTSRRDNATPLQGGRTEEECVRVRY
jgi:hypothetical protein